MAHFVLSLQEPIKRPEENTSGQDEVVNEIMNLDVVQSLTIGTTQPFNDEDYPAIIFTYVGKESADVVWTYSKGEAGEKLRDLEFAMILSAGMLIKVGVAQT